MICVDICYNMIVWCVLIRYHIVVMSDSVMIVLCVLSSKDNICVMVWCVFGRCDNGVVCYNLVIVRCVLSRCDILC